MVFYSKIYSRRSVPVFKEEVLLTGRWLEDGTMSSWLGLSHLTVQQGPGEIPLQEEDLLQDKATESDSLLGWTEKGGSLLTPKWEGCVRA